MQDWSVEDTFFLNDRDYMDQQPECKLLMCLFKKMQLSTYSTAYSGIDSPGTAYMMLRVAAGYQLGEGHNFGFPEHVHAVDTWPDQGHLCLFSINLYQSGRFDN